MVFDRYHIVSTDDVAAAMRRVESASVVAGKRDSANLVQKPGPRYP